MTGTKAAAEAVLRELPSVLGACVREDVHGNPREVHLLIRTGSDPADLSRDVRDLLEERLHVHIDQRVISIAQVEEESVVAGGDEPVAEPSPREERQHERGVQREWTELSRSSARLRVEGVESVREEGLLTVIVRLTDDRRSWEGRCTEADAISGLVRAAARATLRAAAAALEERIRLELEGASVVEVQGRPHVLVSALALAPRFGREPRLLTGAHPLESGAEMSAVLASLKAINRTVQLGRETEREP